MNSMGITGQASGAPPVARRRLRWRGREDAAGEWWARPALLALLALTAAAYAWNLSASGYANGFYAAAVQAGTESWKAFFFGSLDSSSFITVDKPPAAFWVMALSGRIFGFSSWSMLAPQALEGVAAVALLYAAIKRWFGAGAGLAAGAMLAMTPVAALMFRFNNPDALLVMLLVASAYTLTRAIEGASTRWIVATGALIGFAFLAKMGQAFLVLPGFGLAYLVAAPTTLRRRVAQLSAGLGALIVACGWWVAIVALLPASSRPFIDGSPDNNIFNLIFGYNGFSRIFGSGGPGGGGGGANFSGSTGVLRLFNDLMGGQASWLLPASLAAPVVGLALRWRAPRTDRSRAALILWGGWLLVTAAIFSFGTGVIHTYYSVALAPAIAALVAIAGAQLWEHRANLWARLIAAVAVAGTAAWSYALLDRTPSWEPWLRTLVIVAAVLAAAGMLGAPLLLARSRQVGIATAIAVAVACFGGPLAYAGETITTTHGGSLPSAGPSVAGASSGGLSNVGFPGVRGGFTGARGGGPGAGSSGSALPSGPPSAAGSGGVGSRFGSPGSATTHSGFARGGVGNVSISTALAALLEKDAGHYRWVAATSGSSDAAAIELATGGKPVMAIGGFNGNGGELTLAQFKAYVARGEIHYYVELGGGGGFGGGFGGRGRLGAAGAVRGGGFGASSTSEIASWVAAHYKSETVGGVTLYVL
jgi:4-amino-4-deoxy-L-arabinose transferase-like glycosyltransferase